MKTLKESLSLHKKFIWISAFLFVVLVGVVQVFAHQESLKIYLGISEPERERIQMEFSRQHGLLPKEVILEQGKYYQIDIFSDHTELGCMSTIYLEGLDETIWELIKGETISFKVDAKKKWSYRFLCAMHVPFFASVIIE